jgi:hypothetical protein
MNDIENPYHSSPHELREEPGRREIGEWKEG